ncbi:unnamed protein product [Dibothriocephalus latus]|uniref:Rubicon Homology domain-containing protein n=1 Tax=Dibothriocephalus latus TaxID=60516 RepID=A0A3P7LX18_DIBLA|nr:unnamed protein product [Dibothriocephalus latus]
MFPGVSEFKTGDPSNTVFDDAALDFYDGRLYCSTCHQNQQAIIPRRILDSWDFSKKPGRYPLFFASYVPDVPPPPQRSPFVNFLP